MIERQVRNVEWSIINKGPFQLHPSINHFILPAEVWFSLSDSEKESYIRRVMSSSVTDTIPDDQPRASAPTCFTTKSIPVNFPPESTRDFSTECIPDEPPTELVPHDFRTEIIPDEFSSEPVTDVFPTQPVTQNCLSPLDVLANAALSESVQDTTGARVANMSLTFSEFYGYLNSQPQETVRGMWDKAVQLVSSPDKMSPAPGCVPTSRMVASHRFKDRPHLVMKGKADGEYKCEKSCPHWNGIKICSHSIAAAESNGELLKFLEWYRQKKSSKAANLSAVVLTDMPKNPGRKGGVPVTSKRATPKLPVDERRKRTYSKATASVSTTAEVPNTNPFFMKKMNTRIQVCQGCRGRLKSAGGSIQPPPFDHCVARKEKRQYRGENGQLKTPSRQTDAHYHLRSACIKAAEPSFVTSSLVVPDDIHLTEVHECYLVQEFGISFI